MPNLFETGVVLTLLVVVGLAAYDSSVNGPIRAKAQKEAEIKQWKDWNDKQVPIIPQAEQVKQFSAEFKGEFSGGFQNHVRQIFVLTDGQTGRKYLTITGCGVTELYRETREEKVGRNKRLVTETKEE